MTLTANVADRAAIERIGVWFGAGLENALAARAALGELQAAHPNAEWVLFGPGSSLFLFEMDARVQVYIPLKSLEARRAAQTRLSYYLEKRAQFKKLRGLQLTACFGVAVLSPNSALNRLVTAQFQNVQKMLRVSGQFIQKALPDFHGTERPLLQAGPQALAFATQLYRKVPPRSHKVLVLLHTEENGNKLERQWQGLQLCAAELGHVPHITVAAVVGDDRLLARHLSKTQPAWLQVNVQQAMGLMAYADQVICTSPLITQICVQMGRSDRLVLLNSHS